MTLYQEIRAAGRSAVTKILGATRPLDVQPGRVAKRMGLPMTGRTLIFPDETAQNAFFDFWLHEFRINGKSVVQSVDPTAAGLTPLETEVLEAKRQSRTSLFQTQKALPKEELVVLRDLLEPDQPEIRLTDHGFSQSLARYGIQLTLFCRLVTLRGIVMTSGFSFVFLSERVPGLLQAYRQKTKKVAPKDLPEQRFVFFFQKHRQLGEEQEYQDVV